MIPSPQTKTLARMGITESKTEKLEKAVVARAIERKKREGASEVPPPQSVTSPQSVSELPAGWQSATDPASGRIYYYNDKGESSWERPS
jgi:hypothetical protein